MATAQDIMGWLTELLGGQGQRDPFPETATDVPDAMRLRRPPPLVPDLGGPGLTSETARYEQPPPPQGDVMGSINRLIRNPSTLAAPLTMMGDALTMGRMRGGPPPLAPRQDPNPYPESGTAQPDERRVGPFTTEVRPAGRLTGAEEEAVITGATQADRDRQRLPPDQEERIIAGATNADRMRPPPFVPGQRPDQRGTGDYIMAFLSGLSGKGGLRSVRQLQESERGRNATYDAVIRQGGTPELARAITENQQLFAPILPSLFNPRTRVIDNRLVDTTTGRVIADFSRYILNPGQVVRDSQNRVIADGGPERRHLSAEDIGRLVNRGSQLNNINRVGSSFDNSFSAPNTGFGGDLSNWIARHMTGRSQGMRRAAQWWQDYQRNVELVERHEMFGAALTPTEQSAWRAADINPNMAPDMIRANLATRHRIMTQGTQRYAQALAASGYDITAISRAFGLEPDALGIRGSGRRDDALATPPGNNSGGDFRILGVR
jgi:hypothetical protein